MRLINADIADNWMKRNKVFIDSNILNAIPTIDPIDALGICRCKDCIYSKPFCNGNDYYICKRCEE